MQSIRGENENLSSKAIFNHDRVGLRKICNSTSMLLFTKVSIASFMRINYRSLHYCELDAFQTKLNAYVKESFTHAREQG